MKLKNIVLDKTFWESIISSLSGFIAQAIITPIFLVPLWWLSGSFFSFISVLQAEIRRFVLIPLLMSFLVNVFLFVGTLSNLNIYLRPPIQPLSHLKETKQFIQSHQKEINLFIYTIPFFTVVTWLIIFIVPYIVSEPLNTALFNASLYVLPFHLGFLMVHLMAIGTETIFLFVRYIIHSNRY